MFFASVCDMLKLQDVEHLLQEATNFTVNIPEFKILQEIRSEALSWICRVHEILDKIRERDDYGVIVEELTCLLNEGAALRIQGQSRSYLLGLVFICWFINLFCFLLQQLRSLLLSRPS